MSGDEPISLKNLKTLWQATEPRHFDDDAMVRALQKRIEAREDGSHRKTVNRSGSRKQAWYALAVSVIAVGIFGVKYTSVHSSRNVPVPRVYTTQPGQRANITLPDGSQVLLAPATTLTATGRDIKLSGEALFNIVQNKEKALTVRVGNTVTRVLGTTFGIRAYKDEDVQVVVQSGKVSVQEHILAAGDMAHVVKDKATIQHGIDVSSMLAWTSGRLVFRDTPIQEVLDELYRTYNVNVRAGSSEVAGWRVNAELDSNQPLIVTLKELAEVLGGHFEKQDNGFVLLHP